MSSMRQPAGNYQYNSPSRPPNSTQSSSSQDYSIPAHLYVERRSTNPVPMNQPNLSQYIDPNRTTVGYQNARAIQTQSTGMYNQKNPGTPSRNVNPALSMNPPSPSQSPYATMGKESLFAKKETRAEIDDSPIVDPNAFYYLHLNERPVAVPPPSASSVKKVTRSNTDSGIDTRPIVNLNAVTQLERRRQQQLEKDSRPRGDDGSGSGVDQRSMVDVNAFRHIEAKPSKNSNPNDNGGVDNRSITNPDAIRNLEARREQKTKKPVDESVVDSRPIINPDAFKYLEQRRDQSSRTNDESTVDARPIVNPDAFKYLEQRRDPSARTNDEGGIDSKPIVNPDAFKYLEQRNLSARRELTESCIDTTSRINPNALEHLERKVMGPVQTNLKESTIDYRPIVNPQAFKWIERKEAPRRVDDGPDVDERSYVNPQAFQKIDRRPGKLSDVCESEIDTRSFILDRNPSALAHLEREPILRMNSTDQGGIDQRSYVPVGAFRHLEFTGEPKEQRGKDFESYGQSDL